MVMEDEGEKTEAPPTPPKTAESKGGYGPGTIFIPGGRGDEVYRALQEKTAFGNTKFGAKILELVGFLKDVKMPGGGQLTGEQKTVIAFTQAKSMNAATDQGLLDTFAEMTALLESEGKAFANSRQQVLNDISKREKDIAKQASEIEERTQLLEKDSAALLAIKKHAEEVSADFDQAWARRKLEIEQEKAQFTTLVKG
jgi:hypothetical protein